MADTDQNPKRYNGVAEDGAGYAAAASLWKKMRDVVAGEEAIHAAGTAYLPRLTEQDDAEYAAYKQRTPFFTATGRTLEALTGLLFGRPSKIDVPKSAEDFMADVTMEGEPFQMFAEDLAREVMTTGRAGVLVDYPVTDGAVIPTAAAEKAMNIRPFWKLYAAEAIKGYRVAQINNQATLVQVRLCECVQEPKPGDLFATVEVEQYRVLELVRQVDGDGVSGVYRGGTYYRQQVYRKDAVGNWQPFGAPIVPKSSSAPLDYIPFQFFGTRTNTPKIMKPPLLDLANLNLHHYTTSADYHHGLHFTGLPTPWMAGFTIPDNEKVRVGSQTILVSSAPDAKAGYLEFTGSGLSESREALKGMEGKMAQLGARLLAPEKLGVEAEGALEIRGRGEQSVMGAVSMGLSLGLSTLLEWTISWQTGKDVEVKVELPREFMPKGMTSQMLVAMLGALTAGKITPRSFIEWMQRYDLIDPTADPDEYMADLETQEPPGLDMGGGFDAQGRPLPKPGATPGLQPAPAV